MKPEEIGRRFGIGVRVAGRIAKERANQPAPQASPTGDVSGQSVNNPAAAPTWSSQSSANARTGAPASSSQNSRLQNSRIAGQAARAAGRGVAGFVKPFGRVGGILWLELTGFFFGLFAVFFAVSLWRTHTDYAQGPHHQQFLIAAVLTAVFTYLSISSFLRTRKK